MNDEGAEMKKQSTKTRVRALKEIGTVQVDASMPIKPKSFIALSQEDEMNPKTQHGQLTGNHTAYVTISNSSQGPKLPCVPAYKKELRK